MFWAGVLHYDTEPLQTSLSEGDKTRRKLGDHTSEEYFAIHVTRSPESEIPRSSRFQEGQFFISRRSFNSLAFVFQLLVCS